MKNTRGNYFSCFRNNSIGKRENQSWFKGTYFKCGEEGYKDFECNFSSKKTRSSSRNSLIQEEDIDAPNEPKKG